MLWTSSVSAADPTGAEGAGVGVEAAAIGEAIRRGGRPEAEAVPDSVAVRAGGSLRLGSVSLRRERSGGRRAAVLGWAWVCRCCATWPRALGRGPVFSCLGIGTPLGVTEREEVPLAVAGVG